MDFDFSEDEKALKAQLRRYLKQSCPTTVVRAVLEGDAGASRKLTKGLAELGWPSIAIPEAYGGQGLGYVALCGVAEELGRALAPTSFGSSIFLAAEALLLFGTEAQRKDHVPRLASGAQVGAFAFAEKAGPLTKTNVEATVSGGKLTGAKTAVVDGLECDFLVVAAKSAGDVRLFLVDANSPGVKRSPLRSIDPTRPIARVEFSSAPADPLGGGDGAGWASVERLLDRAAILFSFEQLGGADAALEMARDYALMRHAFGRPIGAFQAIKHKLADVYIANELARANCYYGAWALAQDTSDLSLAAATARVAGCEASERAARELNQVHGGISVTWAHDCHLYYRRARHLGTCAGAVQQWRDRLTAILARQAAA